jgi:pimeloyl-ACP methyl ester carboxylesterase
MNSLWTTSRGDGRDILLIAGLSDPAESWEAQLDGLSERGWRVTAYDNRGTGRTPLGDEPLTVESMAADAVRVIEQVGAHTPHICAFSGGAAIAQEVAIRHPDLIGGVVLMGTWARPDAHFAAMGAAWRRLAELAPGEREMLEDFFVWIYTAEAHASGMVASVIEETLAFPYPQSGEAFLAQLDAFMAHDAYDRLPQITAPALVLAGSADLVAPPRMGRVVADRIPGAVFEVIEGAAHQPFQEVPELFNDRVDAFFRSVDAAAAVAA